MSIPLFALSLPVMLFALAFPMRSAVNLCSSHRKLELKAQKTQRKKESMVHMRRKDFSALLRTPYTVYHKFEIWTYFFNLH
jgi:hypothetical protein